LVNSLKDEPKQGQALGKDCYKTRMAITSKGKGNKESISDKELDKLLKVAGLL